MDAKVATTIQLLQDRFEQPMISHRSGRWATNEAYFRCLARHGIRVDCSVTPGLNLSHIAGCEKNCGNDYQNAPKGIYRIHPDILEVPMTTRKMRHSWHGSIKHRAKTLLLGDEVWLRPVHMTLDNLKALTTNVMREKECDHLEFMIHSSELMPGGSPYFKTEEDVERMFVMMEKYFDYVSKLDTCCATLQELAR